MVPFNISHTKTNIAGVVPPSRSTLVAPGLPDPLRRGSGNLYKREMITALDSEPLKYASITINMVKGIAMLVCHAHLLAVFLPKMGYISAACIQRFMFFI